MENKNNNVTGHEDCTGCAVCLLTCPVWSQTHDIMLTNAGRARALQAGAEPAELQDSAEACLLCGACSPVCPSGVDTVALTTRLRAAIRGKAAAVSAEKATVDFDPSGWEVFLPGPALRRDKSLFPRLAEAFKAKSIAIPPSDDISEICADLDAGIDPGEERVDRVRKAMSGASGIIAAEGSTHKHLRRLFPRVPVRGLGEELLRRNSGALKPGDLYVIDPRAFNADHKRLLKLYYEMRLATGCTLSTSLQRAAIPAGPARGKKPGFDGEAQARWVLGRCKAERVIVESAEDLETFRSVSQAPVLHISELE